MNHHCATCARPLPDVASIVDVTGAFDSYTRTVPGQVDAHLEVTFRGDPETLIRLGNFLAER